MVAHGIANVNPERIATCDVGDAMVSSEGVDVQHVTVSMSVWICKLSCLCTCQTLMLLMFECAIFVEYLLSIASVLVRSVFVDSVSHCGEFNGPIMCMHKM